eukprot:CAMPEP_0113900002 /NCGR_PEP_ID=MMETSP0780_2-20120614/20403_1 /TAXON_ID=652834 /ORGANISM="Palpitomonas bilix" /LENGTH=195 /DNA_ID=CAMNT_0000892349 /DNA_START=282 /DNA_END=869 /DNA_ORIENTATION=+ /assembly_acc=CAM_ASM_000599
MAEAADIPPQQQGGDEIEPGELVLAARYSDLEDVKYLLSVGIDVNERDEQQRVALHMAAANGDVEVLKVLLAAKGVDVDAANEAKNTPLHYAALNGHAEAVELLLEAGANPAVENDFGRLPAVEAFTRGHHKVEGLLAKARPPPSAEGVEEGEGGKMEGEVVENEDGDMVVRVGDLSVEEGVDVEEADATVESEK